MGIFWMKNIGAGVLVWMQTLGEWAGVGGGVGKDRPALCVDLLGAELLLPNGGLSRGREGARSTAASP